MPGRGNSQHNIRKYRKPINLNIGTLIFLAILFYVIIIVVGYFTQKQIKPYEVKTGSLSVGNVFTGIALREEDPVMSNASGYINYYAREGSKVGAQKLVCTIDENGTLKDMMESAKAAEASELSDSDLASIRSEIMDFNGGFDAKQFSSVYDFKYSLQATASKLASSNVLEDLMKVGGLDSSLISVEYAPESGIVVYSIDGYEQKTADMLTDEDFEVSTYEKRQTKNNDLVAAGDTIYKLVTSEDWSIVIQTDKERAQELLEKEYVMVEFLKNQCTSWGRVSVIDRGQEDPYVVLTFNNSMVTFCTERYVDIELQLNNAEGLKIPNSAIAEREFFLIPKEFVVDSNTGGKAVMVQHYDDSGEATVDMVEVNIYQETETEYYVDNSVLSPGNNLVRPDTNDKFIVAATATLQGVYNINKGYADFKEITILYSNEDYSIIQSNTTYGLNAYDRIVLDASTVQADELIYE